MGPIDGTVVAQPLAPSDIDLPEATQEILEKGKRSWLKNTEVCDMLLNYMVCNLRVAKEPPCKPPGGSLFLFDRKAVRFFRKDNHNWRKKADGKTVRETHEKLKVDNVDMLNCYYAHADRQDGLQRRCYWLLDSEDDIVLVHYLNIGQQRQPSKSCSHMLNEDPTSQLRSEDKRSSSPSDHDMSATSDPDHDPTLAMPPAVARLKHSAAPETDIANSQNMSPVTSEPYMPFLPSMSMEGFFAGIDSKLSSDKLGLEGPLRSNVAVQELLQSWEEEQMNDEPSLLLRAQGPWQEGQMSNGHGAPELQNQLAAASHGLSLIEDMHPGSNNQWSAEACPPGATASQRKVDDSRSCTYPSVQPAVVPLGHADTSLQLQQQLPPLLQQRPKPPNRFLAQTQSAPPIGSLDYLTGGPSIHFRQLAASGGSSQRLDGNQLADYIGLSRSANTFLQRPGPTSSHPGSGFQQSYQRSPHLQQLQGSFSPVSSVGLSSQTAFVQSGPFAMPSSSGRPQPMVQNAFSSHQGLASGLHSRPQSPFGMSLGLSPELSSDRLLQPKSAFPLTLQSSLQAALDQLPKQPKEQGQKEPAAYYDSPFGQPDGSSVSALPFRNSPYVSNATMGSSSHLTEGPAPSKATSMDICQSQGLSAASNQPANVKHHHSAASDKKSVHGLAQPRLPFSGRFSRWQSLAPSPFAVSKPDPSSQPSLGASQSMGHHLEALHPHLLVEDCSYKGTSAEVQRCSEPDTMRKAALALNAQLAQIDKQVLEHIMPRCGHHVRADPQQPGSCSIAQQVQQCEDQLQELEISSQQLLQASSEQAAAVKQTGNGGLAQGDDPYHGHTGLSTAGRPAGKRKIIRRLSDTGSTSYPLFDVLECEPGWDVTQGGAKLLVAANGLDEKQMKEASSHLHVMFDRTEVAATMLWPGVMRCIAPPHAAGSVRLCLTLGDGRPCSKAVSFDYKDTLHAGPSTLHRPSADLTDRDLQLQLLQALLQGQPSPSSTLSGTPLHPVPISGMGPTRMGLMTGTGPMTGLLLDDSSGPSSNRAQLLQALFKLELEGQMPKAEPLHRLSGQAEYASGRLSSPVALNSLPQQGLPMLHLVSALGYDWACPMLVDAGASVLLQDKSGLTALHWAASRGHEACVAALLAKGADPTCLSHTCDSNLGCTAADMASSAGHPGIAAVLAEASLLHALSRAQTGRLPASTVSLLDWQLAHQRPATSSSNDHSLQRKRCRMDQQLHGGLPQPPPSQFISSARDPMTPNIKIVVRKPTAAPQQSIDSSADQAHQRLTHTLAGQFRGGVGVHQPPPASRGVGEGGPAATVAAAKQAVAVLEQQWQRQEQQCGIPGVRRAKRKQRDEVALQRLSYSTKMWTTLKKIAEAELADSTNQAQDSVTRRFLSLAPRVARLNDVVRLGLMSGSCGEADGAAEAAAEAAADEQDAEMGGDARLSEALLQSPQREGQYLPSQTVKVAEEIKGPVVQSVAGNVNDAALIQAVQHIEAMVGKADASGQYERVMRAVKSIHAQPVVRRVMPALHSY